MGSVEGSGGCEGNGESGEGGGKGGKIDVKGLLM